MPNKTSANTAVISRQNQTSESIFALQSRDSGWFKINNTLNRQKTLLQTVCNSCINPFVAAFVGYYDIFHFNCRIGELDMADNSNFNLDALRGELNSLRSQMENLVKSFEEKKGEMTSDAAAKIAKELEHYRNLASRRAHEVYEQGQASLEDVGEHVRNNPIASLAIAFGAGCVISCLFRHLK